MTSDTRAVTPAAAPAVVPAVVPAAVPAAVVNGVEVPVQPATSADPCGPVSVAVSVAVGLSTEDVVAALYLVGGWNVTADDLTDDTAVREYVADVLVNIGAWRLEEARHELVSGVRLPGTPDHEWETLCRRRAHEVFGPPDTPAQDPPTTGAATPGGAGHNSLGSETHHTTRGVHRARGGRRPVELPPAGWWG